MIYLIYLVDDLGRDLSDVDYLDRDLSDLSDIFVFDAPILRSPSLGRHSCFMVGVLLYVLLYVLYDDQVGIRHVFLSPRPLLMPPLPEPRSIFFLCVCVFCFLL